MQLTTSRDQSQTEQQQEQLRKSWLERPIPLPSLIVVFILLCLPAMPTFAQRIAVDPYNSYHRVYAVVPVVGAGSSADPVHPLYAPTVSDINPTSGLLAFTSVMSDDGRYALIEIVARHRSAFAKLLADKSVIAFEKGTVQPSDIEAAFVKHKPAFRFSQFDEVPVR